MSDGFLGDIDPSETPLYRWLRRQHPYKHSDALDAAAYFIPPDLDDEPLHKKIPLIEYLRNQGMKNPERLVMRDEPEAIFFLTGQPLPERCSKCGTEFVFRIQSGCGRLPQVKTECKCQRYKFVFQGEPNDPAQS